MTTKREKLIEKIQIQRELNIRKARTSLWVYQRVIAGDFYNPQRWHLWVLSWTLQYLYERKLTKESFWRICTNKLVPEWFRNTVDWDRLKEDFVYTNLMINTMPRAGKSRTIVNFCDWLLGQSKNNRIITVSYNTDLAADMSRYVRDGIMMEKVDPLDTVFSDIFPDTKIAKGNAGFMKWALEGSFFNYLGAGLEGTITGKGANVTIIDDPIKNAEEAYNARVLDNIWNWYTGTFLSRSEDIGEGSIDIINHTRWSTQDLCGRILDNKEMSPKWLVLSMPAEYDGELLCPDILSRRKYEELRSAMDSNIFRANYLQQPVDVEGRLFTELKTYDTPPDFEKIIAYCDTADEGSDYLACYIGGIKNGEGYILDVIYTQENMQVTEPLTAKKLVENNVNFAKIESNNGGKGFARNVERIIWEKYHTRQIHIEWFHQTQNKMARILTGATFIQDHVYFPANWEKRFPELYVHISTFTKDGKNKHDDGVEALVEWGKMITGEGSINSYMEYMKKLKGATA